jgi:hypothetical protein
MMGCKSPSGPCPLTLLSRLPAPLDPLFSPRSAVLLKKFVLSGIDWQEGREDPYEHVAGILTNVTRLRQARLMLLEPGRGLMPVLVAQLKSPSEMRRRGATGAIKNCCMEAEVRSRVRGGRRGWRESTWPISLHLPPKPPSIKPQSSNPIRQPHPSTLSPGPQKDETLDTITADGSVLSQMMQPISGQEPK